MNPGSENDSLLFRIDPNDAALRHELRQSALWSKKMAVAGIIMQVLTLIGGLGALFAYRTQTVSKSISWYLNIQNTVFAAINIFIAIGLIVSFVHFSRYADRMKRALLLDQHALLSESIRNLRKAFQFSFVMTIFSCFNFFWAALFGAIYQFIFS